MEIDWARLIEERKTSKPGEVKKEPATNVKEEPDLEVKHEAAEEDPSADACTAVVTGSQAVAAASGADRLLDATKGREGSAPPEQPVVPSLLQL